MIYISDTAPSPVKGTAVIHRNTILKKLPLVATDAKTLRVLKAVKIKVW